MIYQLFLPSQYGTQIGGLTSNMKYLINWDELFRGENYNYKKCRVRYEFVSTTLQNQETTTGSNWEYYARTGYLVANFTGSNQGCVLGKNNLGGCVLGTIVPSAPNWPDTAGGVYTYKWISYNNSTLKNRGVEINTPMGTGDLNLQLYCWFSTGATHPSLMTYDQDYEIILEFEFDEDD